MSGYESVPNPKTPTCRLGMEQYWCYTFLPFWKGWEGFVQGFLVAISNTESIMMSIGWQNKHALVQLKQAPFGLNLMVTTKVQKLNSIRGASK